jgi:hypothetical protein
MTSREVEPGNRETHFYLAMALQAVGRMVEL